MKTRECYNVLLSQKLVEELKKRNMEAYYCVTKEEAVKKVLKMIPKDSVVSCGGSATLHEIGLKVALKNEGYKNFLDPDDAQGALAKDKVARQALSADYFLMSSNAITESGELVNIDGYGNRVASLIFGPKNVIVIAGINKVVPNLDAAILRAKKYAAPMTLLIFNKDYPSYDELSKVAEDSCSQLVITSSSMSQGRIKVILVGESLGF
ncbi:lactate utilization protein [Heliobacterium chlorum]|uniref:Lactate utilization protein n=1 Tax=Heliobacterium chlorum TaxID=2698 RepID=A0ABR7T323_HELCL|nr:lactate utilization protein [Heliobacterium chlorum]